MVAARDGEDLDEVTGHFDVEEALEGGERELRRLVVASFLEAEPAHAVEHVRIDGRQTVGVFKKAARLRKVHVSGHPQVGERVARLNVVGIVGEDVLENGLGLFEVTDVLGDHRRIVGEETSSGCSARAVFMTPRASSGLLASMSIRASAVMNRFRCSG